MENLSKYIIYLVILLAFFLLLPKIDKPFFGHHDWNGVFYSNIARNYLRYGYLKTKFGEVTNYGRVEAEDFPDYVKVSATGPQQINDYRDLGYKLIIIR